jgi:hypothetical protein
MRAAPVSHRFTIIGVVIALVLGLSLPYAFAAKGGSCKRTNTCTTDTTAPTVTISSPASGTTVSGTITIGGSASDNVSVQRVDVQVDAGSFASASGTTSWSASFNTSGLANGTHTITARATDSSGNVRSVTETITTSNTTSSPSPSPTPTTSPSPSPTQSTTSSPSHMVTPEGVTIDINSAGSWTTDQIYSMLKASALELSTIGPHLTINVQDTYSSSTASSAGTTNGVYTNFTAIIYLKGVNSTFASQPDAQLAHEYGHAWTLYHLYMTHNGDWSSYLKTRWTDSTGSTTLATDSRLDSSYVWTRSEIIAEDYRLLFGSSLAKSERPVQMNTDIPQPTDQPGLSTFMLNTWA